MAGQVREAIEAQEKLEAEKAEEPTEPKKKKRKKKVRRCSKDAKICKWNGMVEMTSKPIFNWTGVCTWRCVFVLQLLEIEVLYTVYIGYRMI